ncbi:MAG: hypothetical protein HRU33_12420 [Rhodobacteraceae bacterium]|nr:hypothetical protein [Paracoccaceae bacterium]
MTELQNLPQKEQEIWNFLQSRTVVTRSDVTLNCTSPKRIVDQFLDHLIDGKKLTVIGRLGNTRLMTVQSPKQAQRVLEATKPEDQLALWTFIRSQDSFIRSDLFKIEGVSKIAALRFFKTLNEAGLIRSVGKAGTTPQYSILSDAELDQKEKTQRLSKEGRIWCAIRIARRFSPLDLQLSLGQGSDAISLQDIQRYCSMLARAGYLSVLRKARPDKYYAHYQLTNNSGPKPPLEKRVTVVIDTNEERIVYAPGGLL